MNHNKEYLERVFDVKKAIDILCKNKDYKYEIVYENREIVIDWEDFQDIVNILIECID